MNGKKISLIIYPDASTLSAESEEGMDIEFSTCEVEGCWIVVKINDKEISRINPRYIGNIKWKN